MNSVNKIFITFGILVTLLIGGVWQFLQTELFAHFVADYVQEQILKNVKWRFSFSNIDVDMFPPATILKNVSINDEKGIKLDVDSLGLYFSFWDLVSSKWTIERIGIDGGIIEVSRNIGLLAGGEERISIDNYFEYYQREIFPKILFNIKELKITDVRVLGSQYEFFSEQTLIELEETKIRIETEIYNIRSVLMKKIIKNSTLDQFKCKAALTSKWIKLYYMDVRDKLLHLRINGGINNKKALQGELGFEAVGDISDVFHRLKMKNNEQFAGTFSMRGQVSGSPRKPLMNIKLDVKNFSSKYAAGKKVLIEGGIENDILYLSRIDLFTSTGKAKLAKRFDIYDLKEKVAIDHLVKVEATQLHTNQALRVVEETLFPIKGYVTGGAEISWDKDVRILVKPNTIVEKFQLKFEDQTSILQNEIITFNSGLFVVADDGSVLINAQLFFGNSVVDVRGSVGARDLSFKCVSGKFDFTDFGPISGTQLKGKGSVVATISGPHEKVKFRFKLNQHETEIFGFNLGTIKTDLILDLSTLNLNIKKFIGTYGGTNYGGSGSIGFHSDFPILLSIDVPRGSYKDSQYIYKTLLDLLENYPKTLSFTYAGNYTVRGSIENHDYKVRGNVKAKNVWWLGEEMDRVNTKITYENGKLFLSNIVMLKKEGSVSGHLEYNYDSGALKYEASFKKIRCKDIFYYKTLQLGLDGEMEGSLKGESDGIDFSSSSIIKVVNSKVGTASIRNSLVTVYNNKQDLFVNGNVAGDLITFDSYLNLRGRGKKSYLNLSIQSDRINTLAGILSEHNYNDQSLRGRMMANLNAKFDIEDISTLDLVVSIDDFRIKKGPSRLILNKDKNSIIIKNGVIEEWDIEAKGGAQVVRSNGEGSFGKKARIINDFNIDNQIGTIVTPYIESASGKSFGNLVYIHSRDYFKVHMKAEGKKIGLKIKSLPEQLKNISYKLILEDDELLIDHVRGEYGGGNFKSEGSVVFKFPLPILDISFDTERANINFFNKSSTTLNAQGKITGSSLPYKFLGEVNLVNTNIYDDLASLYKMMGLKSGVSKYLPTNILRNRIVYYNYDVNVGLKESAHVKNSILDLLVTGDCHVGGTFDDLKLDGEFLLSPKVSKIKFTGREFSLKEGGLKLHEKDPPRYTLVGETVLNEYNIRLDARGESEKIDIKLTSEPSLPQQDIVSLLTLGITSDISQNLEHEDRQSVTSVGLGSLLVDQLRINEGLNQSLGMQLSVMPEFEQDDDASMLSGRTEGSNVTAGSLKSATKIKLQKKILGVDVSISSTVGGSMKQKQEMKVKWDLMKNISLEGIYEIKDSDDEEIDTNESVGADVKIRWSF